MKTKIRLGKLEKNMLGFAYRNKGKWHTFSTDYTTKKTVSSLRRKGLIKTNKFNMFMITNKGEKIFD